MTMDVHPQLVYYVPLASEVHGPVTAPYSTDQCCKTSHIHSGEGLPRREGMNNMHHALPGNALEASATTVCEGVVQSVRCRMAQPALYFPVFFLLSFLCPLQRLTQHWQSFCSFEVLKLAWVQVLAFLIPTWVVVEWLKAKLLLESVAGPRPTKCRSPLAAVFKTRHKLVQRFFPRSQQTLMTLMHFGVQQLPKFLQALAEPSMPCPIPCACKQGHSPTLQTQNYRQIPDHASAAMSGD